MAVVQAALLGLTAVLLAAQLKPLKPEYAVYLVLAASIGVGFLGLARLGVLLDTLREIGNGIRIRHVYLAALFKMAAHELREMDHTVVLSLVETLKVFME